MADYAYIIEKSTGRIAGQTEHEMTPSDAGERLTVKLVPSDEDLYFYLHQHSCEEAGIYKIELD